MNYKVGDRIRMTTRTWGEAVRDRHSKTVYQRPQVDTYIGTIKSVGPECSFPSAEVVRCTGGNVALGLNAGFQFYPQSNGEGQTVEVLSEQRSMT